MSVGPVKRHDAVRRAHNIAKPRNWAAAEFRLALAEPRSDSSIPHKTEELSIEHADGARTRNRTPCQADDSGHEVQRERHEDGVVRQHKDPILLKEEADGG